MSMARVYASVLLSALPGDASAQSAAQQGLERFAELLASRADLRAALGGPVTTVAEKKKLVEALASRLGLDSVLTRFLDLMIRKGRIGAVSEVAGAFHAVRVEAGGGVLGSVESAEPLSESDVADLAKSFERRLGKKVALTAKVNPDLLAGLRVNVLGTTYDGTLKSKLQRLGQKFLETSFRNH
jgi:F-type H+-transporting ATPase subunit delta